MLDPHLAWFAKSAVGQPGLAATSPVDEAACPNISIYDKFRPERGSHSAITSNPPPAIRWRTGPQLAEQGNNFTYPPRRVHKILVDASCALSCSIEN